MIHDSYVLAIFRYFNFLIYFDQTNLTHRNVVHLCLLLSSIVLAGNGCRGDRSPGVLIRKSDEGRIRVALDRRVVSFPESELVTGTSGTQLGQGLENRVGGESLLILIDGSFGGSFLKYAVLHCHGGNKYCGVVGV